MDPHPGATSTTPVGQAPDASGTESPRASVTPGAMAVPDGVGKSFLVARGEWLGARLKVAMPVAPDGAGSDPLSSVFVVLSQEPAAGTVVAAGTEVTATVKRLDRPPPTTDTTPA
ncbi:hypothetical protein GCM10009810_00120 [Nostocoides vanveenii]|uniref:PASTA domain-containing protein n=2 Tax=Nostocoides vanveenii TaxID=330835 RepID=A0ABN2JYE4_9MICO